MKDQDAAIHELLAIHTRGKVRVAIGVGQWLKYTIPACSILYKLHLQLFLCTYHLHVPKTILKPAAGCCCCSISLYGFGLRLLKLKHLPQQKVYGPRWAGAGGHCPRYYFCFNSAPQPQLCLTS